MGVAAFLYDDSGNQVRELPDPSGGTFDAAGGFDRHLGDPERSLPTMERVDTEGILTLRSTDMIELIADIDTLAATGLKPIEHRGLKRLRVMAEMCRDQPGLHIQFVGD